MIETLDRRHEIYNGTRAYLKTLEQEGRALVIAPSEPLEIGRFEKDRAALDRVRDMGYRDTQAVWPTIQSLCAERAKPSE